MTGSTGRQAHPARILSSFELFAVLGLTALIAIVTILPLGDRPAGNASVAGIVRQGAVLPAATP